MSDEGFRFAATAISLALGVALLVLSYQQETWRSEAISHGYAEYCPLNGAWAWKGECEK